MKIDHRPVPWTEEVRRASVIAIKVAVLRRGASERTLRYFLNAAASHGLTTDELCDASGLARDEVLRLTDPMAA